MPRTSKLIAAISLAIGLFALPTAAGAMISTKRGSETGKGHNGVILGLYSPSSFSDFIYQGIGRAATHHGATRLEMLDEDPDLSSLSPDGVLWVISHGRRDAFTGLGKVIPFERVMNALTRLGKGLPANFRGTIHFAACEFGERPFEAEGLMLDLHKHLVDEGLSEKLAIWITDGFEKNGVLAKVNLSIIEDHLAKKSGLPRAKVTLIMAHLAATNKLVVGKSQTMLERIAHHLKGRTGTVLTGPRGLSLHLRGEQPITLKPVVGPAILSWSRNVHLEKDLESYLLGGATEETQLKLFDYGFPPASLSEQFGTVDRFTYELNTAEKQALSALPLLERSVALQKRFEQAGRKTQAIFKSHPNLPRFIFPNDPRLSTVTEWFWPEDKAFQKVMVQ